jgi:hypothetical protein
VARICAERREVLGLEDSADRIGLQQSAHTSVSHWTSRCANFRTIFLLRSWPLLIFNNVRQSCSLALKLLRTPRISKLVTARKS